MIYNDIRPISNLWDCLRIVRTIPQRCDELIFIEGSVIIRGASALALGQISKSCNSYTLYDIAYMQDRCKPLQYLPKKSIVLLKTKKLMMR